MAENQVHSNRHRETTEWDDIQRSIGNLPELLPEPKPEPYEPEREERVSKESMAGKTVQELENLEDDLDVQDDQFLEQYRLQRLAELKKNLEGPKFGSMQQITAADFVREVTHAGQNQWVLVYLFKDQHPGCEVLGKHLEGLSERYTHIKFVKIVSTECIPGYPDCNLPTLLAYLNTDVAHTFVGLEPYGGGRCSPEDVALAIQSVGVKLAKGSQRDKKGEHVSTGEDEDGENTEKGQLQRERVMRLLVEMAENEIADEDSDFGDDDD